MIALVPFILCVLCFAWAANADAESEATPGSDLWRAGSCFWFAGVACLVWFLTVLA